MLLFDGATSLAILQQTLKEQGVPSGSSINYFAKEKRERSLVL
jgi:hypothetical protein